MPTRTNRVTGEVQEQQGDGTWKTIVPPKQAPAFSVNTRPPDQTLPAKITTANNEAKASAFTPGKAAAEVRIAQLEARIKAAEAATVTAKNDTELQIARANLEKTQAEIAQLKTGKGSALGALQTQVDRVGELYRSNLHGGLPNAINNVVPDFLQPKVDDFDSA